MGTTVIIPCRNEETTIGDIVTVFQNHKETCGNVYVAIDSETTDATAVNTTIRGGNIVDTGVHGKGENVAAAIGMIDRISERIILCDGDYTGLKTRHIDRLIHPPKRVKPAEMVIGIPEYPQIAVPSYVIEAWPHVSGFRYLPWFWIPVNAHGYLLETQINKEMFAKNAPVQHVHMTKLIAPFQWPLSDRRMAALQADRLWGKRSGIL